MWVGGFACVPACMRVYTCVDRWEDMCMVWCKHVCAWDRDLSKCVYISVEQAEARSEQQTLQSWVGVIGDCGQPGMET